MGSFYINEELLKQGIAEICERNSVLERAGNLTVEQTDLMIRLLSSKKPEDIEDISTEQVIACFEFIPEFASVMSYRSIFDCNFSVKLEKTPTGLRTRRRII